MPWQERQAQQPAVSATPGVMSRNELAAPVGTLCDNLETEPSGRGHGLFSTVNEMRTNTMRHESQGDAQRAPKTRKTPPARADGAR